jgi:hypothetical protein
MQSPVSSCIVCSTQESPYRIFCFGQYRHCGTRSETSDCLSKNLRRPETLAYSGGLESRAVAPVVAPVIGPPLYRSSTPRSPELEVAHMSFT